MHSGSNQHPAWVALVLFDLGMSQAGTDDIRQRQTRQDQGRMMLCMTGSYARRVDVQRELQVVGMASAELNMMDDGR